MDFSGKVSLPPFIDTDAEMVESKAIGIKAFAIGSQDRNQLGGEVQHLPKFRFTSASFFLRFLGRRYVNHGSDKFDKMPGRTQDRMAHNVNIPCGAARMDDAIVCFPLFFIADRGLNYFT